MEVYMLLRLLQSPDESRVILRRCVEDFSHSGTSSMFKLLLLLSSSHLIFLKDIYLGWRKLHVCVRVD